MNKLPKLSIVIPAYNEGKNIYKTVDQIVRCHDDLDYDYEVIVVDDGSKDNTIAEAKRHHSAKVKVVSYGQNHGKGYALKYGTMKATGDVITYTDAGGDFNPEQFDKFIKVLEAFDADMVIGSKRHPASKVDYPLKRRFFSWGYHKFVNTVFGLHVTDTQAGLKVLKTSVAKKIMPLLLVKRYAFDLEMLVVANQLGFHRLFEAPVELSFNNVVSGINYRQILKMFTDTLAIFYRARILNYYRKQVAK